MWPSVHHLPTARRGFDGDKRAFSDPVPLALRFGRLRTRSKPRGDVLADLEPRADDYYVVKYRWNAFFQTYLDLALRTRSIDTVIISGGSTDVGVTSTLYSGRDLDYNLIVASDACGTSHDQRAHDMLMELVFPRMARVRTTDQVIEMVQKARV